MISMDRTLNWNGEGIVDAPPQTEALQDRPPDHPESLRPVSDRKGFTLMRKNRFLSDRKGEHLFEGPSPVESAVDEAGPNSKTLGPLRHAQGLSVEGDDPVAATVPGLLGGSGPSAIAGFVGPVVVYPLDLMFGGWSDPYIGEEGGEGFSPPRAERDATASVSLPAMSVWIVTASDDRPPAFVGGSTGHSVGLSWFPEVANVLLADHCDVFSRLKEIDTFDYSLSWQGKLWGSEKELGIHYHFNGDIP